MSQYPDGNLVDPYAEWTGAAADRTEPGGPAHDVPQTPKLDPAAHDAPPVWGAPANAEPTMSDAMSDATVDGKKKMSSTAKTLAAVGVAAVIAVGGTIAVTSANASASSSSQQGGPGGSSQGGGPGGGGFGGGNGETSGFSGGSMMPGAGGALSVIRSALHGQFVVADGSSTITEQIQTGAVTAVSSASITVKSTDNYSATYVVGSSLDVAAYTTGTDVTVIATVEGSTLMATSVTAARTAPGGSTGRTGSSPGGTGGSASGRPTI